MPLSAHKTRGDRQPRILDAVKHERAASGLNDFQYDKSKLFFNFKNRRNLSKENQN